MRICNLCRTENDDKFLFCKNCGTKFPEDTPSPAIPTQPISSQGLGLVPVTLKLPDINNHRVLTPQTVYVTPAQKMAIDKALKGE